MPPRSKKQNASASEKRHDSGLIAPGKKISKDKHPAPAPAPAPASAAASGLAANVTAHHLTPGAAQPNLASAVSSFAAPSPTEDATHEPAPFDAAEMAKSSCSAPALHASPDEPVDGDDPDSAILNDKVHHSLANGHHSTKQNASTIATSTYAALESVTTVIRPHSQWDVFAILLLLLQLPPFLLVLVQVSFTFMTFGNNANIWSLFSLHSAPDWFRSHAGNPSVVATLLIDIFFTCLWLSLPFLKDFVLDLAPAVVALSLGGGAAVASKHSWKHGIVCLVTVSIGRVFQERQRRQYFLNLAWTALSKASLNHLPFVASWAILPTYQHGPARSWARIVLELHIVTHGFVRVIRRWIDQSSQSAAKSNINSGNSPSKGDYEPISPSHTANSTSHHAPGDSTPESIRNGSTDGRSLGQPASRDKPPFSGKKRRKQATLVRSQQPFWAAIATTKIQVSKEIEQSYVERDNFEASATTINDLGDATANSLDDRVWITKVDETEVWFTASLHNVAHRKLSDPEASSSSSLSSTYPTSRRGSTEPSPVDVRINGAFWSSVDAQQNNLNGASDLPPRMTSETHGKIFGLTPATTYLVDFVRAGEETSIFSAALLTPSAEANGQVTATATAAAASQPQDPMRPSSPITTLNQSIETAEAKLADHKTRSNKARKGRQGTTRNLKQEVSDLSRSLASVSTNERQQQRQIQYRQNIKQAEDAAAELASQIAGLGEIPRADQKAFDTSKSSWTEVDKRRQALKKEVEYRKRDGQRKANDAHQENGKLRSKKEKSDVRLASLQERRKATAEENDAKRNAKALSETQHAYKLDNYRMVDCGLTRDVGMWEGQRREIEAKLTQMTPVQEPFFEGGFASASKGHMNMPPTPESHYSGPAGPAGRPGPGMTNFGMNAYPMTAPPTGMPGQPQPQQQQQQHQPPRSRGRSSSMLSDISGFTEEEMGPHYGMEPPPLNTAVGAIGRDIVRNDSGSPRSAGPNSSQKPSPIGSEAVRSSPRQMKR